MRTNRRLQASALLLVLFFSGNLFSSVAQSKDRKNDVPFAKLPDGGNAAPAVFGDIARNEFGVWGGGSLVTAGISGTSRDVKLGIVGLRYARVLSSGKVAILKYTADAIPFAVLSYLRKEPLQTASGLSSSRPHPTVYAMGAAPIGLQVNFKSRHRVQPYLNFSGGCLFFADTIPKNVGKQFNFTAEAGGGIQILTSSHRAITLGYKLHHISNGGRSNFNPGFGSNFFYLGFSFFR